MKEIETPKVINELIENLLTDLPIIILFINLIALCVAYAEEINQFAMKVVTYLFK